VRTALRIFGFASLVVAGVLVAAPLLAALIPGCPAPPQCFYPAGIGAGLFSVFVFVVVAELFERDEG
jgi:hypothetical protein